jgi:succinate dehydrogenase flavin-adding protein (antitoxin of CptAB toxin-antitoxin module)
MKELDILLERFVLGRSAALDAGEWPEFEALLAEEDDLLWNLLQDPGTPGGESYRTLLAEIRQYRA